MKPQQERDPRWLRTWARTGRLPATTSRQRIAQRVRAIQTAQLQALAEALPRTSGFWNHGSHLRRWYVPVMAELHQRSQTQSSVEEFARSLVDRSDHETDSDYQLQVARVTAGLKTISDPNWPATHAADRRRPILIALLAAASTLILGVLAFAHVLDPTWIGIAGVSIAVALVVWLGVALIRTPHDAAAERPSDSADRLSQA